MARVLGGYFDNREFEDGLVGGEAEGADFLGSVRKKSDDEVGDAGVKGEFDVARRGVIVGMGMGVVDAEEFLAGGAELPEDGEDFGGVDFVGGAGGGGGIFCWVDISDGGVGTGEETAGFSFGMRFGVLEELVEDGGGDEDGGRHQDLHAEACVRRIKLVGRNIPTRKPDVWGTRRKFQPKNQTGKRS